MKTVNDILELVRDVIETELEIPTGQLRDDLSLRSQYGLDSVAAVNIIFTLETALNVEIDPADFVVTDSLNDIRLYLARRLPELNS